MYDIIPTGGKTGDFTSFFVDLVTTDPMSRSGCLCGLWSGRLLGICHTTVMITPEPPIVDGSTFARDLHVTETEG